MTDFKASDRDVSRAIRSWLHEDRHEDASRIAGAVLDRTEATPRRRATWWPVRRTPNMNRFVTIGLGVAAVVVVGLLLSTQLLGSPTGADVVSSPTPTATPEPTTGPTPDATPRSDPDGDLAAGTYTAHPLPAPNDSLTLTFTVPEGWGGMADPGTLGVLVPGGEPGTGPPGGMAIMFNDVTTLNDPCDWRGTADDISVGPAVDDLVEALLAQPAYEVSDPVDVSIGGYSGKRVVIVHPTEPFAGQDSDAPECDQGVFQLWNTAAWGEDGIYAQGPADRWQTNILDVDGTRLVIVTRDFAGTSPADRAEMDAIIDSLVIEP